VIDDSLGKYFHKQKTNKPLEIMPRFSHECYFLNNFHGSTFFAASIFKHIYIIKTVTKATENEKESFQFF
jgi:hypothetical protein